MGKNWNSWVWLLRPDKNVNQLGCLRKWKRVWFHGIFCSVSCLSHMEKWDCLPNSLPRRNINVYVWIHFRWLKFEEDVEDGGDRWSKPYVATLSLHSLFELRSCILNGTVMLDMRADTLDEIAGCSKNF